MASTYKTILSPAGPSVYKEKGSKFLGYAFPVSSPEEVKEILQKVKKEHHAARHWCYAYRLGISPTEERFNDDGEPTYSAGKPILQQIQSRQLTNTLVVVVRYFGGVKLGVGGLIQAYKTAAKDVLEMSETVEKIPLETIRISFDYALMNRVMQYLKKHQIPVKDMQTADKVTLTLEVSSEQSAKIKNIPGNIELI